MKVRVLTWNGNGSSSWPISITEHDFTTKADWTLGNVLSRSIGKALKEVEKGRATDVTLEIIKPKEVM